MNPNSKPVKRSVGREYAFKFIYKHLLPDFAREKNLIIKDTRAFEEALNLFDQSYYEEDSEHPDNVIDPHTKIFARELILESLRQEEKNSSLIERYLTSGNLQKVDPMNLAVLLMGAYEINNTVDTSPSVFINEYINIAKKYCPNGSQGFINSILDKLAHGPTN